MKNPLLGVASMLGNLFRILSTVLCLNFVGTPMTHAAPVDAIQTMPDNFVYISDIDPTIVQSPRYYSEDNFMGRQVPGYQSKQMVLTEKAALALNAVQAAVNKQGYTLVIYDTYRPQRACDAFKAWSLDLKDTKAKALYYPTLDKSVLFEQGYIGEKSTHSRGSTVDLTLLPLNQTLKPITVSEKVLNTGRAIPFLDDGTVDMGASFDLFDEVSHQNCQLITKEQLALREYLKAEMIKQGFEPYPVEWWHFTLKNETYPNTHFDFVVQD